MSSSAYTRPSMSRSASCAAFPTASRILFVFPSTYDLRTGRRTEYNLPEAAHPYWALAPTHAIDFASPTGANPPVDKTSIFKNFADERCVRFLTDAGVKTKLAGARRLADVDLRAYAAVFHLGAGAGLDLPYDPLALELANGFQTAGMMLSAICGEPMAGGLPGSAETFA